MGQLSRAEQCVLKCLKTVVDQLKPPSCEKNKGGGNNLPEHVEGDEYILIWSSMRIEVLPSQRQLSVKEKKEVDAAVELVMQEKGSLEALTYESKACRKQLAK